MAAGFLTSALAELMRAVLRDRAARGPEPLLTVGSIEPGPRGSCQNKRGGERRAGQSRAAPSPLNMIPRARVFWAALVVVGVLVAESHCVQKTTLSKNWGPQSMLYLKGKYGRRFVPDAEEDVSNSGLRRWFTVIKEFQKLKAVAAGGPTRFFTAENLLIRYTE